MLQDNPVVDEANVFGGVVGFGPFLPQEVEDPSGQHGELAVLDEFAEMGQACLFALRVLLNDADDAVHDGSLVLKAALRRKRKNQLEIPKYFRDFELVRQERTSFKKVTDTQCF